MAKSRYRSRTLSQVSVSEVTVSTTSLLYTDNIEWSKNTFNSISYFLYGWCVHIAHTFFTTQKQCSWDAKSETIHQQPQRLVSIIQNA